jgi:NTP pyrophosphatase (non-canonical NTP hydrolase)
MDKLESMFQMRKEFMAALSAHVPNAYPGMPIDLSSKNSQQHFRDLALRGVEEIFEALQHLKNTKPHRVTEITDPVDVDAFKEEMVDAFNFFFTLLILMDVEADDLYRTFVMKDEIIHQRIKNRY